MPSEIRTRVLDADTLAGQCRVLCDLCVDLDPIGLDVSYGWACDLDQDELYLDHRIETRGLALIRFRGHVPKGGYDVPNGERCVGPASPAAVL